MSNFFKQIQTGINTTPLQKALSLTGRTASRGVKHFASNKYAQKQNFQTLLNYLNELNQNLAISQQLLTQTRLNPPPSFGSHPSAFGSPHSFYGQFHGFLFTCDGLQAGFYSDVYNECRYFHLCHQPSLKFFNPLNQLAITTYACPELTYFNQRRLACTRLEEFETPCADQIHLFKRSDSSKVALGKPEKSEEQKLIEQLNDKLILNEAAYKKLLQSRTENQKLLNEYANKLTSDSLETNSEVTHSQATNGQASTVGSAVVPNLESAVNSENATESSSVDSMLEKERAVANKKDEKVESSDLIETTFNCEGRFNCFEISLSTDDVRSSNSEPLIQSN